MVVVVARNMRLSVIVSDNLGMGFLVRLMNIRYPRTNTNQISLSVGRGLGQVVQTGNMIVAKDRIDSLRIVRQFGGDKIPSVPQIVPFSLAAQFLPH